MKVLFTDDLHSPERAPAELLYSKATCKSKWRFQSPAEFECQGDWHPLEKKRVACRSVVLQETLNGCEELWLLLVSSLGISFNPFTPKSDLIDFTLSNARRFYSSKGDSLGVKGLKTISLNPFTPKSDLIDFTLSNVRRLYSSKGDPLGVKWLKGFGDKSEKSVHSLATVTRCILEISEWLVTHYIVRPLPK